MENEEYIESGLSVGAVKYVDPNEIITEEEYNYIKNKVPELDGRVGVIEDEIEEINSSLADKVNKYTEFNVRDYGAKGDGVTDDSEAIRRCIDDLPNENFKLIFPPGLYIQGDGTNPHYEKGSNGAYSGEPSIGKPISFVFENKKNFTVEGYGACIEAHKDNSCINNNRGFEFSQCENGTISGLKYNGNISNRKPWGADGGSYNNQSGFTIRSSKHITLKDIVSNDCVMDGFSVYGSYINGEYIYSEYIRLENCIAERNYRQGMSVVNAHNGTCINCQFNYTGTIYGTSPRDGVDLEQGYSGYTDRGQKNWIFDKCVFKGNAGDGLALHWGTYNANVTNCYFEDNGIFTPKDSDYLTRDNNICNNIFYNWKTFSIDGGGACVNGNKFYNDTVKSTISINDSANLYKKGFCRKQMFKNNYFECKLKMHDLTSTNLDMTQIFFNNEVEIESNEFINLTRIVDGTVQISFNATGLTLGSIVKNNRFTYNDDRVTGVMGKVVISNSIDRNSNEYSPLYGMTFKRPTMIETQKGYSIYDTNLLKPIYWNGTNWTDCNGSVV